jgi:hypothetical protein
MTLREQIEQRRRQWEAFNRWEKQQPPFERDPAQILADLGAVLRWIPKEDRLRETDPGKCGVQITAGSLRGFESPAMTGLEASETDRP